MNDEDAAQPTNADLLKAIQGQTTKIVDLEKSVQANSDTLGDFMTDITKITTKHENDIQSLQSELKTVECKATAALIDINEIQQRNRLYNTRFFNVKLDDLQSNTQKGHRIYELFIKPVLEKLAKKKTIPSVPDFFAVHNVSHPLPARSENEIPPYHFRFHSKDLNELFAKNCDEHIQEYNDTNTTSVFIRRDLTAANRACMSLLHKFTEKKEIAGYWIAGTEIRFCYEDEITHKVWNPFGKNIKEMELVVKPDLSAPRSKLPSLPTKRGGRVGGRGGGRGRGGRGGTSKGGRGRGGTGGDGGSGVAGQSGNDISSSQPSASSSNPQTGPPSRASSVESLTRSSKTRAATNTANAIAAITAPEI